MTTKITVTNELTNITESLFLSKQYTERTTKFIQRFITEPNIETFGVDIFDIENVDSDNLELTYYNFGMEFIYINNREEAVKVVVQAKTTREEYNELLSYI